MLRGFASKVRAPKEGMIAYRVVRVIDDQITSVYSHATRKKWWVEKFVPLVMNEKMKCKNYTGFKVADATKPSMKNEIGFYAFNTYKEALESQRRIRWGRGEAGLSIARVRLFGDVIKYDNGYRAEYMQIEAIVCGRRPKVK